MTPCSPEAGGGELKILTGVVRIHSRGPFNPQCGRTARHRPFKTGEARAALATVTIWSLVVASAQSSLKN